jgi:hypothetical protein
VALGSVAATTGYGAGGGGSADDNGTTDLEIGSGGGGGGTCIEDIVITPGSLSGGVTVTIGAASGTGNSGSAGICVVEEWVAL